MFTAILDKFFATSTPGGASVRDQLLRLEILALNFSETLSLSPLFRELDREINRVGTYDGLMYRVDRAIDLNRLRGLAKRVNGWQLSRLGVAGESFEFDAPVAEMESFGQSVYEFKDLDLGGVPRDYLITVARPDTLLRTVDVTLEIVTKIATNATDATDARGGARALQISYAAGDPVCAPRW